MTRQIVLIDIGDGMALDGVLPSVALLSPYFGSVAARGGSGPYTYTVTWGEAALNAAGIYLDRNTGEFTADSVVTPNALPITVRATDITGASVDRSWVINVIVYPDVLTISGTFAAATVGVHYDSFITIAGGDGHYLLTGGTGLASGSFPDGLVPSIVGNELHLIGSATTGGTVSFVVSVDDESGQTATSVQSVVVITIASSTKYLLHFDDEVGSHSFLDQATGQYWTSSTVSSGGVISSDASAFGGRSYKGRAPCLAPGSDGDMDFNPQGRDFTIQAFARLDNAVSYNDWKCIFSCGYPYLLLGVVKNSNLMRFRFRHEGGTLELLGPDTPVGSWVFWEVCRVGASVYLFKDGILVNSAAVVGSFIGGLNRTTIGAAMGVAQNCNWDGYIDELRVIDGIGLYTEDHDVPSGPF